jgi:hypothetical protein
MMPDSRNDKGPRESALRRDGAVPAFNGSGDPRFDRWLNRRLHEAYDSVLKEQVPAELDQLVRQLSLQQDEAAGHNGHGGAAREEAATDAAVQDARGIGCDRPSSFLASGLQLLRG